MITKKITTPSGYECEFWVIKFFELSLFENKIRVILCGFKTEELAKSATSPKQAIHTLEYLYNVSDFSEEAFSNVEKAFEEGYNKILTMPEFK